MHKVSWDLLPQELIGHCAEFLQIEDRCALRDASRRTYRLLSKFLPDRRLLQVKRIWEEIRLKERAEGLRWAMGGGWFIARLPKDLTEHKLREQVKRIEESIQKFRYPVFKD